MSWSHVSVEEEFKKNNELKKEIFDNLKDWVEKQPHLPKMTDQMIILFMHSCYYSNEAAKVTIDKFFTLRRHCPEFFTNLTLKDKSLQNSFTILQTPLPTYTPEGYNIVYCKLIDTDPSLFSFPMMMKVFDMVSMFWLAQVGTYPGHVVLMDFKGSTVSHFTKIGLLHMKKYLMYFQEALPVRVKGIHFINTPPFIDLLLSLMKPFMSKELLDMFHIYGENYESLYKFIPRKCLPKDYGGEAPKISELLDKMRNDLRVNEDFFVENEKLVVDESKRPGKPKDAAELFGVEGSFKKLSID